MNKGYFYLMATALCWSFIGVLIRFNTQSALLINGVTSLIALLFTLLVSRPKITLHPIVVLVGITQFFTSITFVYANQLTGVGNAVVLQYTSMIFVLIYQSIDRRRLPPFRYIMIILLAILGMLLFFFDELSSEGMLGNLLAIISGACFGLQFYLNTKPKAMPLCSTALSFATSSTMLFFLIPDLHDVRPQEWGAMLLSGVVCSGVAGLLFAKGIRMCNAFSANIICMSEVILAPLWSFLLFHETLGVRSAIGAVIIVCSILINMFFDIRRITAADTVRDIDTQNKIVGKDDT